MRDVELVAVSEKTIGRLSVYRRLLLRLAEERAESVYSYQLAAAASVTAAQVRRDIIVLGYSGSPSKGYEVALLLESIDAFLDGEKGEGIALVGVGHLGRAVLDFFYQRRRGLYIAAGFDVKMGKIDRVIHGCRIHHFRDIRQRVSEMGIKLGIITVPAEAAQDVTISLVDSGVTGILNFAPVPLRVPASVFVENIDLTMAIEKVAYFSRKSK